MTRARRISVSVIALISGLIASAQEQSLTFHYISHARGCDEGRLITSLTLACPADREEAAIFYLANADRPVVACINLPGATEENFALILSELNSKSSHEVYPEADLRRLIEIFDRYDFLSPGFNHFTFNWYIDSSFWTFYNESVIAKACFILDFDALDPDYFLMQIFDCGEGGLPCDASRPFGVKNLCGNCKITPKVLQ